MRTFWKYAAMMLHYRRLLLIALSGAVVDALCVAGGFGTLTWVIAQFFEKERSIRDIAMQKLSGPFIEQYMPWMKGLAEIMPQGQMAGLAFVLGIVLVLTIIGSAGRFVHEYFAMTVTLRTTMRIRRMLFDKLILLPMTSMTKDGATEHISRIVRDTMMLAGGYGALVSRTIRGIFVGVALLIGAFIVDPWITSTFLVIVPPVAIMTRRFGKTVRRASKKALKQSAAMLADTTEALHGIRVVKVHHTEGYERRRFNRVNRRMLMQEMKARTASSLSSPVVETVSIVGVMGVVLVAAYSVFESGRQPQELVSVLMMLAASAGSFRQMAGFNVKLQAAAAAAEAIDRVLNMPTEPTPRDPSQRAARRLPRHTRCIDFEHVGFTYPAADHPALIDIHLSIKQGQTCAIVGGNGSGKTTLLSLLPRLYDPTTGRILIDGFDIAQCTLRSVRRQMAVVTQDTVLFDGTIAENILYGSRHVGERRMIEAAKAAHAHEFVMKQPQGYDSTVGERGQRLSGGQRQRIAIARAILRNPAILILDEATSQIDADSEAKINAALSAFMRDRTTLVIAHRLSTVIHADQIVVLDAGRVEAVGRHDQLLQTCERYRLLCQTQIHASA